MKNSSLHPSWAIEFDEKFRVDDCDFSEKTGEIKQFIRECIDDAVLEEKSEWIKGCRCADCGSEMEPKPLTGTCKDCWQNN